MEYNECEGGEEGVSATWESMKKRRDEKEIPSNSAKAMKTTYCEDKCHEEWKESWHFWILRWLVFSRAFGEHESSFNQLAVFSIHHVVPTYGASFVFVFKYLTRWFGSFSKLTCGEHTEPNHEFTRRAKVRARQHSGRELQCDTVAANPASTHNFLFIGYLLVL